MAAFLPIFAMCLLSFSSADGQEVPGKETTASLTGPDLFVTDGNRELNLTCQTNMSSVFSYGWTLPGPRQCNSQTKVCTFRPRRDDDGRIITCSVLNSSYAVISTATFRLNLKYPPADTPVIHITPPSTEPLTQGDNITCTASGGKPRVTSVIFHCQNPNLADQEDDVSFDEHTVSSSITVNTSQATYQDMACVCSANWATKPELYNRTTEREFAIQYPPRTKPIITVKSLKTESLNVTNNTGTSLSEPLKQGDIITCTVSGGKPRVKSVLFHCQHPDHAGSEDEVSDDVTTVSSYITVDTDHATEVNMTCTCSANWAPRPGMYPEKTMRSFPLEYRATVTKFTMNYNSALKAMDNNKPTATFECHGAGRPSPVLRLYKKGNDTAMKETAPNTNLSKLLYIKTNVRGEDMGTYICEADNNFTNNVHATVQLFVDSIPRIMDISYDPKHPPDLHDAGSIFHFVAYPTPNLTEPYFLGPDIVMKGEPAQENTFQTQFTRDTFREYLVKCHVTPQHVPKDKLGFYELFISNGLGRVPLRFKVTSPVPPPPQPPPIIGILIGCGAVLLVVIIVSIAFFRRQRRLKTAIKKHQGSSDIKIDEINAAVISNTPTTSTPQEPRPVSTTSDTYAKVNDASKSMGILSEAGYATPGDVGKTDSGSTDSKGNAVVNCTINNSEQDVYNRLHGDNVPPIDSTIYSHLDADSRGAQQEELADSATPNSIASRPDQPTDKIIGPKGDVYATVAPKQKGGNPSRTDEVQT